MKIVAFSDTHSYHRMVKVPDGDVLVFAGDAMTDGYSEWELSDFIKWFSEQPHKHKIFVAGNHDQLLDWQKNMDAIRQEAKIRENGIIYLKNSGIEINGIKFWGCHYQPQFFNWAFNVPRGQMHEHWDKVCTDTDVLITHGPPHGVCDQSSPKNKTQHLGDKELTEAIYRVLPKVVICGHIHGGYGAALLKTTDNPVVPYVPVFNVAICDEAYRPVNDPSIVEVSK